MDIAEEFEGELWRVGTNCAGDKDCWNIYKKYGFIVFGHDRSAVSPGATTKPSVSVQGNPGGKNYPKKLHNIEIGDVVVAAQGTSIEGIGVVADEVGWDPKLPYDVTEIVDDNNVYYVPVFWMYDYSEGNLEFDAERKQGTLNQGDFEIKTESHSEFANHLSNLSNLRRSILDSRKQLGLPPYQQEDPQLNLSSSYLYKVSNGNIDWSYTRHKGVENSNKEQFESYSPNTMVWSYTLQGDFDKGDMVFFVFGDRIQGHGIYYKNDSDSGDSGEFVCILSTPDVEIPKEMKEALSEVIGEKVDYKEGGVHNIEQELPTQYDQKFWHRLLKGQVQFRPQVDFSERSEHLENMKPAELHFEDSDRLFNEITRALENDSHILFYGPPGTGKSKLAKVVCDTYVDDEFELVTATSDWTTYDTIGGYQPQGHGGSLEFEPGFVLKRFKCQNGLQKNEWLIIDELNRADIDKAFGPLFSLLAGDQVTLPYDAGKQQGTQPEPVTIVPEKHADSDKKHPSTYVMPEDWRMIATMNTRDKASLYQMSYAFMRRWSFIPVGMPDELNLADYVETWKKNADEQGEYEININEGIIEKIWDIDGLQIGPAIIEDIVTYISKFDDEEDQMEALGSALGMYVLPQLEGVNERKESESVSEKLQKKLGELDSDSAAAAKDRFKKHENEFFS